MDLRIECGLEGGRCLEAGRWLEDGHWSESYIYIRMILYSSSSLSFKIKLYDGKVITEFNKSRWIKVMINLYKKK